MGLNLFRFAFDAHYRAVKRWKWAEGDKRLAFDFPLTRDSLVLDLGAYEGAYTRAIALHSGAQIHAFEPIPRYAEACRENVVDLANVHIHPFGLSNADFTEKMTVDGLSSSKFRQSGTTVEASFRDIHTTLGELGITEVDLAAINIEGGEYEVIPRLIETGMIGNFNNLMVQFHLIRPDDKAQYAAIAQDLRKTHDLLWRYPFVWECWRKRGARGPVPAVPKH